MRKSPALFFVAAMTAALVSVSAPSASAASNTACSTTGARGGVYVNWVSSTKLDPVTLSVYDILADGHHVAVRLVTINNSGSVKRWSWHHIYGGNNDSGIWDTYAYDANGIKGATAEVATFEGDQWLESNTCDMMYR